MQLSGKWDKTKYAGTSSQCSNSLYALQIHWSFPCTSHSYSSFLFLCGSGYRFLLKIAKRSHLVVPTLCHTRVLCPWYSPGRILEWIAISFSRGFSPPRDQTWVSHIGGRFFTVWATSEALTVQSHHLSLSQSSRLFRNSYVRGYCFSWDEYFWEWQNVLVTIL